MKILPSKKTWKSVFKVISEADIVLEILDSRDPESFRNKKIEEIATKQGKKLILVINKSDLVPKDTLEKWKRKLSKEYPTVYISSKDRLGTRILRKTILKHASRIPVKVALIGYPNVGKSSIINVLKGKHSAGTSPIPGFTKHSQLFRITPKIFILDTPGVYPAEDEVSLMLKSALEVEKIKDPINCALELIKFVKEKDPEQLIKAYGIESNDDLEFLEKLAIKRGRLLKGGEPDVEEMARIILRDWQRGKIIVWKDPE
ncbi:MAG: GTPase [Candidatus Baldrarchaeia archaeon]